MSDRLLAAALAANGVGSFGYHARYGRASKWAHDWAVSALLWLLALGPVRPRLRHPLELAGLGATAVGHATCPRATPWVQSATAASLLVAAVRPGPEGSAGTQAGRRRRRASLALFLGAGGVAYATGRTGSRWCRPDSRLQAHAAWHVLAAAASTGYALDAARARLRNPD